MGSILRTIRFSVRRLLITTLPLWLALAAIGLFVACTPQWLPDSSGFVFVSASGQVRLYDLKTRTARRLADLNVLGFLAAAGVWPGGDRVAVAKVVPNGDKVGVQVLVFDLKGKQTHASPIHPVPLNKMEGWLWSVHVSPDGAHVLAYFPTIARVVVYRPKDCCFRDIGPVMPLGNLQGGAPLVFDISPITRDGKGFLASPDDKRHDPKPALYPWDGGEPQPFDVDTDKDAARILRDKVNEQEGDVVPIFRWQQNVLVARGGQGVLKYNPADRTLRYSPDRRTEELQRHARKHKVLVLCELADGALLQFSAAKEIQLWRPAKGGTVTKIITLDKPTGPSPLSAAPSPDGRYVVLRTAQPPSAGELWVIDAKEATIEKIPDKSPLGR